jgi:hypothetical protein
MVDGLLAAKTRCLLDQLVWYDQDLTLLQVGLEILRFDDDPVADSESPKATLGDRRPERSHAAWGLTGRVLEGNAPGRSGG